MAPLRALWKRIAPGKSGATLAIVACLLLTTGLAAVLTVFVARRRSEARVTLADVLTTLESGRYAEARQLAERLYVQQEPSAGDLAGAAYALGIAAAHEADQTWQESKTKSYARAAFYLEEARDRGFPPGREGIGLYTLGRSLYYSGQYGDCRAALHSALKLNPPHKTEIHRLLSSAYFNDAKPDLPQALAENLSYLADQHLPQTARHQGLLHRAQILFRLGQTAECLTVLKQIPAEAESYAGAMLLHAQVLMREAQTIQHKAAATAQEQQQAREKLDQAIKTLRQVQRRGSLDERVAGKVTYLTGLCLLQSGDELAAAEQLARTVRLFGDSPEGLAATMEQADLARRTAHDDEAIAAYRRVLASVGVLERFRNPWITLDQIRTRMTDAYQYYLKNQQFERSLQLASRFPLLFPLERAVQWTADARRAWGESLLATAQSMPPEKAETLRTKARAQWRQAGAAYEHLARLQYTTRNYPDRLWDSAQAYLDGHDYRRAARMLQNYLKEEPRRRRAEALADQGAALLTIGRADEALDALLECVHLHPRDPASFRARLWASRAYVEKGKLQDAETLLRVNLNGEYLDPASHEWRQSLFALGEILHAAKRYGEAARRLEEAIERYPDVRQSAEARYLIADSYYHLAQADREKLKQDPSGAAGLIRPGQIGESLEKAIDQYSQVRDLLSRRRESGELSPREKSILRNCYFAVGDVRFDLGQYESAIKAYTATTNRYQNEPEVLEAYVQIANAYQRLGKPVEARTALEQARAVLSRMKTDAAFAKTTNYTREEWQDRLSLLAAFYP